MINYSKQSISNKDILAVNKVLKSNFLTQGPMVTKFENEIKKITKSKFAVAVNSATSALHLSCLALGLKKGDWLWTSANSFVASSNCALLCGAKVDLIDINLLDYNIDILKLKQKLEIAKRKNKLPKIVMPVHFAGRPCNMKEIYKLSLKYKFKIIEDASHALGSKIYGKPIGNCKYSSVCVFSFHPVKNITTAEGGMLTTNNKRLFNTANMLRTHGINKDKSFFRNKKAPPWFFEQILLGFNYRMNDLEAALGISQVKKLNSFLLKRNRISKTYNLKLKNTGLILPKIDKKIFNAFHLYPVRLPAGNEKQKRLSLYEFLKKKGINTNVHYIPIYQHPYYKKIGFKVKNFPNCEKYYNSSLSLPVYPDLNKKQLNKIVKLIRKFMMFNT